jgi:PDZ domain-containing protein
VNYPVPYYIFTSGGITDLSDRFEIEDSYEQKGSYNLSYVNQIDGNVLTYLVSKVFPGWDTVKIDNYQYNSNESFEELSMRDKIALTNANQKAVLFAYRKANKEINIHGKKIYMYASYDFLESDKKIKIGDILLSVDGNLIDSVVSVKDIINSKEVGDTIEFEFQRGESTYKTNLKVKEVSGVKAVGIILYTIYDIEVKPEITFKFRDTESGSSAGLMTTLAIYDSLVPEDLTGGLKIAGTGTIEEDESVGPIGGVKYKLAGAESDGADIFFAPSGENYNEAIRIKNEKNYNIIVIEVKTLDDAINFLKKINSN